MGIFMSDRCNFKNVILETHTIVSHDMLIRVYVKGYEALDSYSRSITYPAPLFEITTLIDNSEGCKQFLKVILIYSIVAYDYICQS